MKIHSCIQGTTEWAELRSGIPTASQFSRIITPRGKASDSAEMYLFELLAERILGQPTVTHTSHWMDRGSEKEEEAVSFYEFLRDDLGTVKVGFITNDAGTIGASPDRLVGDKGLLEIKVGKPATHMGLLLKSGSAYEKHKIQAQGQLWVAEREWNDLLAYNPGLPPALYRVDRDEEFIALLESAVGAFSGMLEDLFLDCVQRGWVQERHRGELSETELSALRDRYLKDRYQIGDPYDLKHLPPLEELVKSAQK